MPKVEKKTTTKTKPKSKKTAPIDLDSLQVHDPDVPVVSYSEIDCYRQCPLKHLLAYRNRWTKPKDDSSPLSKGTAWHNIMERHYLMLQERQQEFGFPLSEQQQAEFRLEVLAHQIAEGAFGQVMQEPTELESLMEWMYLGYLDRWGADPDWEILAVEAKVQDYLPDLNVLLKGRLDLIVRNSRGQVIIVDHKSGANLPSQFDLQLDDQFGLYSWLLRSRGLQADLLIHNAARTTRNTADYDDYQGKLKPQTLEQRTHRTVLNRTDVELDNIARDAAVVADLIHPGNHNDGETVSFTPVYSSPDPRQCGWKCDFSEVHLLARTGRDLDEVLSEYGFEQDFTRH